MQNKVNIEALLVRALKTFLQAFSAALLASVVTPVSIPALRAVVIGALAAGVSAVMNLFLQPQEAK